MFIINVEGAVYRGDKWLLIKRSAKEEHAGGTLSLAGGKADPGDGSQQLLERTLRRELLEEVGVEVKEDVMFLYSSSFVTDRGQQAVNVVFLCEHASGEAHVASPDEVESVHWLTADEAAAHPDAPPWTLESIRRAEEARVRLLPKKQFALQRRQLLAGFFLFPMLVVMDVVSIFIDPARPPFLTAMQLLAVAGASFATGLFVREWFVLREREKEKARAEG